MASLSALPFQVAAPFRVDVHAADIERSFAPRRQLQQQRAPLCIARRRLQAGDGFPPALEVAVRRCRHPLFRYRLQGFEPALELQFAEDAREGAGIGHAHRIAMMDTKLK